MVGWPLDPGWGVVLSSHWSDNNIKMGSEEKKCISGTKQRLVV